MGLKQKLKKILEERFPPPATIELREGDGIIGILVSKQFRRMSRMKRQDVVHELLESKLTPSELRKVLIIVAVTPEEELADRAMSET